MINTWNTVSSNPNDDNSSFLSITLFSFFPLFSIFCSLTLCHKTLDLQQSRDSTGSSPFCCFYYETWFFHFFLVFFFIVGIMLLYRCILPIWWISPCWRPCEKKARFNQPSTLYMCAAPNGYSTSFSFHIQHKHTHLITIYSMIWTVHQVILECVWCKAMMDYYTTIWKQ